MQTQDSEIQSPWRPAFRRLMAGLASFALLCALAACNGPSSKLTQDNLDKVQKDMSTADVKAILGDPTATQDEPIPIVGGTKTTYTYDDPPAHVVIVFKNDHMETKEGQFGSTP